MKREHKSGDDRLIETRRRDGGPRNEVDARKEGLVLLVIALLFVANVVLYLCHHYGFTSQNDLGAKAAVSARVVVD
jgi:hypothetical protein